MSTSESQQPAERLPAAIAPFLEVMASFPATWALCGGWALDAFVGRISREHGDIDLSVFAPDQQVLLEHLRGSWQMLPHGPTVGQGNAEAWDGAWLEPPSHIHARRDTGEALPTDGIAKVEEGWALDIQIDERAGDDWVLSREPRITFPLKDAIQVSDWGVPVVSPEVLLFFKSRDLRRRDKLDFATMLPRLMPAQRAWLRDAVAAVGHPWLAELSA